MIAYKCLRPGGIGPFSRVRWPLPDSGPGAWLVAQPSPCAAGIHACHAGQLAYWLNWELWEVELDGEVVETGHKLVAPRGRLLRRVEAWNRQTQEAFCRACSERVLARDAGNPELEAYRLNAAVFMEVGEPPAMFALMAARAAQVDEGDEARTAERRWQAAWLGEHLALATA